MSDGFRPVRHDPPLAERRFRHREMGDEALLSVRIVHPPGGPFHDVETCRPDRSPVPGVMFSTWAGDRERAREVWREREQALRRPATSKIARKPVSEQLRAEPMERPASAQGGNEEMHHGHGRNAPER